MTPFTCPFCGFEVENDEETETYIPDEAEHDSWN